MKTSIPCILCGSEAHPFRIARKRHYYRCSFCQSVLLDPDDYVTAGEEKSRYETHNNDVNDPRYQQFVSPIVDEILKNQKPAEHGLDYGCGTGPVITKLLRDQKYHINTYDPFFDRDRKLLRQKYHYIACCEVAEHFHDPYTEFSGLKNILHPGGILYCMTELYHEDIDFNQWNYKNDETHVIFYHRKALEWIKDQFNFSRLTIHENKLVLFRG